MPETTVTYYATRDSATPGLSDENRAMTHVDIYKGDDLQTAQRSLRDYMRKEIAHLTTSDWGPTSTGLRRAADIMDAIAAVMTSVPETGKAWSAAEVTAAGLVWRIVRTERPAAG